VGRPKSTPPPSQIGELLGRIQTWRSTRKSGMAMPEHLWKEAAGWASRFGRHAICQTLGLNEQAMQKHLEVGRTMGLRHMPETVKTVRPTFVELDGSCFGGGPVVPPGPTVEVTSPDGGRLVMRLAPGSTVDAIGLLESFLGRHG
jgi:hypothetical protein